MQVRVCRVKPEARPAAQSPPNSPLGALRAVEDHLGWLVEVVSAVVGAPALLVLRQPHGPAFHTARDERNAPSSDTPRV
jgi:hypothetical protein